MYVCLYVCMYVCMYVCISIYIYIRTNTYTYITPQTLTLKPCTPNPEELSLHSDIPGAYDTEWIKNIERGFLAVYTVDASPRNMWV